MTPAKGRYLLLGNYIKTSLRNIKRGILFSGINIVGLSLSMSLGLLLISGIAYLFTFDHFHENKEDVYRLITNVDDVYYGKRAYATTSTALAADLVNTYDGINNLVRLNSSFGGDATNSIKTIPIDGLYADSDFFSVFSFDLKEGSSESALKSPFSIILTEQLAAKFFDNKNAVGEYIEVEDLGTFQVAAIMEDLPSNSHLQFESLVSYATLEVLSNQGKSFLNHTDYGDLNNGYIYFHLHEEADIAKLESVLEKLGEQVSAQLPSNDYSYELQALTDIVPGRALLNQIGPEMESIVLVLLSILVSIIILATCFNYTNLSFARSLNRTKEVALRKTLGGSRFQIFAQFITESILIALISLVVALLLSQLIKPHIYSIDAGIKEMFLLDITPIVGVYSIIFAILVGLLAGVIPALILSKQNTVKLFRGIAELQFLRFINLRKSLIIFQFTLSLVCIIAAIIITKQFSFTMKFDMGFARNDILNIQLQGVNHELLMDELSGIPKVGSLSMSSALLGVGARSRHWLSTNLNQDSLLVNYISASPDFINTLGIPLLAGRDFNEYDSNSLIEPVIVNEKFLSEFQLGHSHEGIKQVVYDTKNNPFQIIGVAKNFNYDRLREPIGSFFIRSKPDSYAFANVKVIGPASVTTVEKVETAWKQIDKVHEFKAEFYNDRLKEALSFYPVTSKLLGFTAFLTVFIACMGLLGIVIYTCRSRVKEIAIRKVLGADERGLVYLLSKSFFKMMTIATVISVSLTYILFNKLILPLEAFSTTAEFWDFSLGVIIIVGLGMATIISQTIKVARTNPAIAVQA